MKKYSKGARSERELLMNFYNLNYSVMRAAGSGVNSLSPDIIAIKDEKAYAFECKAWDSNLSIEPERLESLKQWAKNTKMQVFIAWRLNNKGWFFIKLDELSKNNKNYTITKSQAIIINRKFESIL